jgi:DNA-binding GntR family transcriptional regulator
MAQAVDLVYRAVRDGILTGSHPAGSRLREEELAAAIGVSRTPVREALRRLHAEGLVEVLPVRGAVVARWGDHDLDEIFELRTLLEGYGSRRASERVTPDQLENLISLCDEMDRRLHRPSKRAYDEITELNLQFHQMIHGATENKRLLVLLSNLIHVPLVQHNFHRYTPAELARSFSHHRELVDALTARDGDWAESVMHSHIRAARASFKRANHTLEAVEGEAGA